MFGGEPVSTVDQIPRADLSLLVANLFRFREDCVLNNSIGSCAEKVSSKIQEKNETILLYIRGGAGKSGVCEKRTITQD